MPSQTFYKAAARLGVSFPCSNGDYLRVLRAAGELIAPEPVPGPKWSKETLAADARLAELNEQIGDLRDKLFHAERRAASRDELTFGSGMFGTRTIPGDPAAREEAERLRDELVRLEGEHVATAKQLSSSRARDERRHRLRATGLVGKVKAAIA